MKTATLEEKIETTKINWLANKQLYTDITIEDFFEDLITDGVISNKDDIEKIEYGKYEFNTKEGYIVEILVTEDENITIGNVVSEKKALPRIRTIMTNSANNSITVNSTRAEKIIYSYKLKEEQNFTKYQEIEVTEDETTITIPELIGDKVYTIKVEAINNNGSIAKDNINETTSKLETATIKQKGELVWDDGLAIIELETTAKNFYIEYQINGTKKDGWTKTDKAGEDVKISKLKDGDVIFLKLWNEKKSSKLDSAIVIKDNIAPIVKIASKTSTTDCIMVEANSIDEEYGMFNNPKYVFYYKKQGESDKSYKEFENITGTIATQGGLSQSTEYTVKVEVTDKAGNTGTITGVQETQRIIGATGQIIVSDPAWSNQKASIILSTTSGYKIEYKDRITGTWIGTSSEEDYVKVTGLSYNETVFARLKDKSNNYGEETSIVILDKIAPTVKISNINSTINSITVRAIANDNEYGMPNNPTYTYYYKKQGEADSRYKEFKNIVGATASQTGLEEEATYDVKVEVKDTAGNTGIITGKINTKIVTGVITTTGVTWNNAKASITLNTSTGNKIEYKKGNTEEWISATNTPITVKNLEHEDIVYIKLTDEENNYIQEASIAIMDETAPQSANITLSKTNVTTSSDITATIVQQDNQSGVDIANCKWVVNTSFKAIGTESSKYTGGEFTESTQTSSTAITSTSEIPLTLTTSGKYYLHVLTVDKAGKATETVSGAIFVNSAPTIPEVTLSNKTMYSITVNTKASDSDGHKLIYKLYVDEILKATSIETTSGKAVSLTASGLSQYTSYNYYVTITDGYETIVSTKQSERTYCSGTTISCTPIECSGGTFTSCTVCEGDGIVTNTSKCSNCNGHGKINSTNTATCDTCEGKEKIITTTTVVCRNCNGNGSITENGILICSNCDGSGKNVATITKNCLDCNGSGSKVFTVPLKCNYCNEIGFITTSLECINCNGKGGWNEKCSHGKNTVHYYCEHGRTNSSIHYYCEHSTKGKQHD